MATRPSTLPRWATDGAAAVATPSSGKQDTGWEVAEKPAAHYANWLAELTYDWLNYVNELQDEPQTLAMSIYSATVVSATYDNGAGGGPMLVGGGIARFPIHLPVGAQLDEVRAYVQAVNVNQITMTVYKCEFSGETLTDLGNDASVTGGGTQYDELVVTGLAETAAQSGTPSAWDSYYIQFDFDSDANLQLHSVEVDYTGVIGVPAL